MLETLARPAASSDRAAAATSAMRLVIDERDRLVVLDQGGERTTTDTVARAWFLNGDVLPRHLAPTASNGAVLIEDVSGSLNLVPIDDWWMAPVSIVPKELALRSSGLSALLDRFGTEDPPPGHFASAHVLTSTDERRRRRSQKILVVVILLGLGAFLTDAFGPIVLAMTRTPDAPAFGWISAGAAAANAFVVLIVAAGRRRRPRSADAPALRPVAGPSWFLNAASISADDQGLVLVDGQGIAQRLATPDRHLGPDAVVRAAFVHDEDPRVLLIDGTDTVRAQLPLRLWAPSPDEALVLREFLQRLGVLTVASDDLRNQPALALDEMRSSRVGPSSLMLPNVLGAVPAYPFLASSAFTTVVLAGARSAGSGDTATIVTALFAAIAVATVAAVFVVESSSRLPVARIRPEQHGRPDQPALTRRHLVAVGIPLIGAAVAVWYFEQGNIFSATSILLLVFAVPLVSWLTFRRRRAERGKAPVGLGRWIVIGAPRGDE
jgi:hypothetical protein